jgi:SNF2 family DNA or RNA helicase
MEIRHFKWKSAHFKWKSANNFNWKSSDYQIHFDLPADLQIPSWFGYLDVPKILRYLAEHAPKHEYRIARRGNKKLGIKRHIVSVPAEKLGEIRDDEIDYFLAAHFDEWAEAAERGEGETSIESKPVSQERRRRLLEDKVASAVASTRQNTERIQEAERKKGSRLTVQERERFMLAVSGNGLSLPIPELKTELNLPSCNSSAPKDILAALASDAPLKLQLSRRGQTVFGSDVISLMNFVRYYFERIVPKADASEIRTEELEGLLRHVENRQHDARDWGMSIRISSPSPSGPNWRCELCGVDRDDESAFFGARDDATKQLTDVQRGMMLSFIHRERERVKELWLPLSRIVQPDTSCQTTVDEVVALLGSSSEELAAEGVHVLLPKELVSGRESRVKKKCVVTEDVPRKPGTLKKDVILRFQVGLAVDGETLSPEELQNLASIREPLVKARGKWLYIDPAIKGELEKIAQEVLDHSIQSVSEAEAVSQILTNEVQDASGSNAVPTEFEIGADGIQRLLDSFRSGSPPEITLPTGLNATLRDYQLHGLNWLAMLGDYGLGACLADDMGLGKTLQTLAWLQQRKESGITEPALLICPTSVITNWEKEARRFTPKLRVFRQHGPNRPDNDLKFFARVIKESTDLVITSFGTMCQDLELFQSLNWKWSAVILDEAQNIKNPNTTQSKAARSLSEYATSRLALTGTPVENGPRDLWPIMEFLNPGMLGTWSEYVKNVASPIEHEKERNHREELRAKIKPFILRRKKTDPGIAPELPQKIEQNVECFLTREQAGWYQASLNNMKASLESKDKKERQGAILKVLQELKQVCNGVAVLQKDRSQISSRAGKITQLISMLADVVENDEKAIVFSQYPSQFDELADLLMDRLKDKTCRPVGVLTLTGNDLPHARDKTQDDFKGNKRFSVLLISVRAGGTGLNLQSANHVFHLDRWWNGAVEDQATDRAWRIGQKKVVHAHKFVCRGTLEERIDAMISKKRKLASDLLGDEDQDEDSVVSHLAKLDTDALYDVLRLDESEAVIDDDSEGGDEDDI